MLTETARYMCLKAISNRARIIKREINRILNLASFQEFPTIVAEIPIPDDLDWDLFEPSRENSEIGWSTWDDFEDWAPGPDMLSSAILDENDLQDERSDASSLSRLVEVLGVHGKRGGSDGTARRACDMQTPARNPVHPSGNLADTVMPAVPLRYPSQDCPVCLPTPRLNGDKSLSDVPLQGQVVVHNPFSGEHPLDAPKTNLREYFIQQWNEAAHVQLDDSSVASINSEGRKILCIP
ncbi:hypothetical protein LX36DRAFT_697338 [Colletotrichum falcatum]|nr:hypothetical protein LX36DRAFT_697338 [Colletotrichum falcatum]